jgi:hypothetical protein
MCELFTKWSGQIIVIIVVIFIVLWAMQVVRGQKFHQKMEENDIAIS